MQIHIDDKITYFLLNYFHAELDKYVFINLIYSMCKISRQKDKTVKRGIISCLI